MMGTDVLDNVESVNIAKFIPEYANEPFHPFFETYRTTIEDFSRVRPLISHPPAETLYTLYTCLFDINTEITGFS
jgi:hypothetical protein